MSKFQLILLIVFGVFILVAVMIFSITRAGGGDRATVVVWGDIPTFDWNDLAIAAKFSSDKTLTIRYVEKSRDTIVGEYTEALADGTAPDLIIFPLSNFWSQRNRLVPIPYDSISERDFRETFVELGENFLTPEGIYALPMVLDPMVLYYNRDILSEAGIAEPMAYWDEIYDASSVLTKRDPAGNITQSIMALGEAGNIPNYKSILSLLMLQAGTPITVFKGNPPNIRLTSALKDNPGLPQNPADSALDFYTQFSNPARAFYSWNRSELPAQTHFIAGDSAYYLGFASEERLLRAKNPTLNLGLAPVPQSRVSQGKVTYGELRGVAISRGSRNVPASLLAALKIVSRDSLTALTGITRLPPTRRDLLSLRPEGLEQGVFYEAALQARGWIDPERTATMAIFREMIESVTSGRARVSEATGKADRELDLLTR